MSKRVSLKGRGAEIFFGDDGPVPGVLPPTPPATMAPPVPKQQEQPATTQSTPAPVTVLPETAAPLPTPVAPVQPNQASQQADLLASNLATLQESTEATSQESKQAAPAQSPPASPEAGIAAQVRSALQSQGLKANTFRYAQAELDAIRDIVYELETKYKRKLDKNDLVRIALNWLIHDFQARKQASFLVRMLTSKE